MTPAAGILSILVFIFLAVVSYLYYPTAFNPRDNWLSDLGNGLLNPSGAWLYRIDAILVGVLLGLFFLGLSVLWSGQITRVKLFVFLTQVFGVIAAFAVIMTGIFSEGLHASHSLWSAIIYISFGTAVLFSGFAFLRHPGFPRSLSYLAFAITVIDWIMAAFNTTHFLEWIMVTLMLVYVGAVAYRMRRPVGEARPRTAEPLA